VHKSRMEGADKTMVQAYVTSQIDYSNSILNGVRVVATECTQHHSMNHTDQI